MGLRPGHPTSEIHFEQYSQNRIALHRAARRGTQRGDEQTADHYEPKADRIAEGFTLDQPTIFGEHASANLVGRHFDCSILRLRVLQEPTDANESRDC